MDQDAFDNLARRLALPLTRRGGLRGMAAAIAGLTVGISAADAARKASRRHEKLACRNLHSQCTSDDQCCTNNCAPVPPYEGTGFRCARGHHRRNDRKNKKGGAPDCPPQACTVCPTCAHTTIASAYEDALPGDTIWIAPGTYHEAFSVTSDFATPITFDRCGCTGDVIWQGLLLGAQSVGPTPAGPAAADQMLLIMGGVNATVRNIIFDGNPDASVDGSQLVVSGNLGANDPAVVTIEDCTFRNAISDSYGSPTVSAHGFATLTMSRCHFHDNSSTDADAVYMDGENGDVSVTITDTIVEGGGIEPGIGVREATAVLMGCSISGSRVGLSLERAARVTVVDSTIQHNTSTGSAAGIFVQAFFSNPDFHPYLALEGTTAVLNNAADTVAGGITVYGAYATVTGAESRVSNNSPANCAQSSDDWVTINYDCNFPGL